MTFREKLADWISGGEYSRYKSGEAWASEFIRAQHLSGVYKNALVRIIEQKTPGANATVTRMARIAREALGE